MRERIILIIDDEENFAYLTKVRIESMGNFSVYTAPDGKSGIALAKKIKPVLIFLDICMPGMDGYQVLEKLKKDKATAAVPVIMLTALGDEKSRAKATELYDEDYLTKPVEPEVLKEKIEKILKIRWV